MVIVVLLSILKNLFEGWLGRIGFPFTIPRTIFCRLSGSLKNFLDAQKVLYITNGHFFGFCPKKFLGPERRNLRAHSKKSFHYSTGRINRGVTVLSCCRFSLTLQRAFFPENLAPLFQKTSLAFDLPST